MWEAACQWLSPLPNVISHGAVRAAGEKAERGRERVVLPWAFLDLCQQGRAQGSVRWGRADSREQRASGRPSEKQRQLGRKRWRREEQEQEAEAC